LTASASDEILVRAPTEEEEVMFARISTYRGDTDQLVDGFRRTIAPLELAVRAATAGRHPAAVVAVVL
jgi:hypothetical protein